ncbi:MAG: hypothetical protein ACREOG_10900, partial [Gemmatimonadaceae bacterium]
MALSRSQHTQPSHGTGASQIAGAVLPIRRAEELLSTLPGVIAARIIASDTGTVDEIHILTSADVAPKQTVRNVESALIAHLGMRVDHRKISVATTQEAKKPSVEVPAGPPVVERELRPSATSKVAQPVAQQATSVTQRPPSFAPRESAAPRESHVAREAAPRESSARESVTPPIPRPQVALLSQPSRAYYFEDIEVRRS